MRERWQELIAAWLGKADGVVIADGSGFPRQGTHSVGVAYQYCSPGGKVANCQEGVFLVYASSHGYAFLDERPYLPEAWFTDEYRERRRCNVINDLVDCARRECFSGYRRGGCALTLEQY